MALVRMRESICMPNSYYQDVTETAPKELKESLNNMKARITESSFDAEKLIKTLRESNVEESIVNLVANKLRETGVNLNEHRLYKVPVAKINPPGTLNGNHRRYPKELWENVMNNQQDRWCGLCGLADHPTDDCDPGSIKNSSIVWLGMDIDPVTNLVYGIGTFVGPFGHMFQEIIDAGGRVGFSSSGFGELMSDGETVNPDTYTIERLADVVLNPSQEVYGEIADEQKVGNIEYTKQNAVKESVETPKSAILNKKITESKENNMADTKPTGAYVKAQEKALRAHINTFLNENSEIVNPLDRLTDLNEVLTIIHEGKLTDLEDGVVSKLEEMKLQLEKDIDDATKMKEALGSNDLAQITSDTQKLMETGTILADQVADYKTLVEGLTARNRELSKRVKIMEMKATINEKKSEKAGKARNKELVGATTAFEAIKEEFNAYKKTAAKKIGTLNETIARYEKGNKDLERKVSLLETKLDEANKVFKNNAKLREGKVTIDKADVELFESLKEENKALTGMVERLQKRNADLKAQLKESKSETSEAISMYNEATTPDIHIKPTYTERASKYFNWKENQGVDIENFWSDCVARYGEAMAPFERQIRDAKTLKEAQSQFYKVMPIVDPDAKAANIATFAEGGQDIKERTRILESSGMNIDRGDDTEFANSSFAEMRKKFGLM